MLRLQTYFVCVCFTFPDFIPTVWTKMHQNKHQSNSLISVGFLWEPGCEGEVRVPVEGSTSMGSQIEQMIWFTVWCEGTTSLDFAQAFEKLAGRG